MNDSTLKHDVENELKWEPSVDEAHIGVTANDGVVTLTGHVASYAEKHAAERATKRIFGVKAVANDLEVRLPGSVIRSDEDIAAACVGALQAHDAVPKQKIKVVVRNGWVTLEGKVEWQFQKDAADAAVRYLTGITGLSNHVEIRPRVSAGDVQGKIEAALKRSAEIDAARIRVEAREGKVCLRGRVRSWVEREEAQHAAWSAPGVTEVENHITVGP